ncbi:hypothetical protein ACYSNW_04690 [Enterococcus sp. LJL99]
MKKKKIVSLIVVLSTLVVLLAGTTVAFATGALDFNDFFYVKNEDKATLEVASRSQLRRRVYNPWTLITKVTDADGNSVDPTNVEIVAVEGFYCDYDNNTYWVELPINDVISPDDNTVNFNEQVNGEYYNIRRYTFRYTYETDDYYSDGKIKNSIEKTVTVTPPGY